MPPALEFLDRGFLRLSLSTRRLLILCVVILGIGARFAVSAWGFNYDFESYVIVSSSSLAGDGFFVEGRYTTGPVWGLVLTFFAWLSSGDAQIFRFLIIGILILADLLIAWLLAQKVAVIAGLLFLLDPISIFITGFHNQFDNIAIALALLAVVIGRDRVVGQWNGRDWSVVLLLGISLTVKHIFIFFVFWVALKQIGAWRKMGYMLIPLMVFLGSFLPFWSSSSSNILEQVFLYRSFNNAPLWIAVFSDELLTIARPMLLFILVMLAAGIVTRKMGSWNAALWYTILVVVASSALSNQQLAIPIAASIAFINLGFIVWTGASTFHLIGDVNGLGVSAVGEFAPLLGRGNYSLLVGLLAVGGIIAALTQLHLWKSISQVFQREINFQWSSIKNHRE